MFSPLLALFIRSLREDSRLKLTYFARAALVLLIAIFLFTTQSELGWTNAPGLQFFETVTLVDLCFVVLSGVSYFASAVSEEKEEATLGLLRMTDLNPLSILLGKSTSRLGVATLLFAAQFPFTLLSITLGGISLRQIVAAYVAIVAFLFFVSNLALLASVICRRTSGAAVFTGVALLLFFGLGPLARWSANAPVSMGWLPMGNLWTVTITSLAGYAEMASPFFRIEQVLGTRPFPRTVEFQAWSNVGLAAFCFLLAWLVFEVFCGEQKESDSGRVGLVSSRGRRRFLSPGRAWRRALAWKDFYFTTGGKLWIGIKLLIYGTPLAAILCWPRQFGGSPSWEDFGVGAFFMMLLFIGVELAFTAATIFRQEIQGQTLSSLAMLPQGMGRVAYQKLLGVLPALGAAGTYLILTVPLLLKPLRRLLAPDEFVSYPDALIPFAFLASQAIFFLHLVAFLSLFVKRGALPLAIGIEALIFFLLAAMGGLADPIAILPICVTLCATAFLHFDIGARLKTLAAEG